MSIVVRVVAVDRGWDKILADSRLIADDPYVKVGLLEGKGSATHGKSGLTVATIGALHEYGVPGKFPERSWLRGTFDAFIWIYQDSFKRIAQAFFAGRLEIKTALDTIGASFASDIKSRISIGKIPPPNAPSTIARKHNDRTLIDTLQLYDAIEFKTVLDGKVPGVPLGEGES